MLMRYRCEICDREFELKPRTRCCPSCRVQLPAALVRPSAADPRRHLATPRTKPKTPSATNTRPTSATGQIPAALPAARNVGHPPTVSSRVARRSPQSVATNSERYGKLENIGRLWYMHWQDAPTERVQPSGALPASFLEGVLLPWRVRDKARPPIVEPVDGRALKVLTVQFAYAAPSPEARFRKINLGPTLPGTSELERIKDPRAQIERTRVLSEKKDDPEAWAELANGYRVKALRRPIEQAIKGIGWHKVLRLVTDHPVIDGGQTWPDGLYEFLQAERRRYLASRPDGQLADEAIKRGDYGTVED